MHEHGNRRMLRLAERVSGNAAQARQWLNRPSLQLGGRRPMELPAQVDDDDRLKID